MNARVPENVVPFSRVLDVDSIGDDPLTIALAAGEEERAALAKLNGLESVEQLEADLTVAREGRSGVQVTGELSARVRQVCVVSLDPFEADISEPIEVHFLPEAELLALEAKRSKAREPDVPEEDLPDPIVNGRIDLGAVTAEFLSLALDPYPRKPGVTYVAPETPPGDEAEISPFAALRRLKS